jgi:hypothetical protein
MALAPARAFEDATPGEAAAAWVGGVLGTATVRFERLTGGGNNRVYRVDHAAGACVLKQYFDDGRSRRAAESAFLRYCETQQVTGVPRLLAESASEQLALHSYVAGERPSATPAVVRQLRDLLAAMNRGRPAATTIGDASDACAAPVDHMAGLRRRVDRLLMAAHDGALQDDARGEVARFVRDHLDPATMDVSGRVQQRLRRAGVDPDRKLARPEQILSPSDIGLHNALLGPDGQLVLIDFEYAGWDDPAKLVGDLHGHIDAGLPLADVLTVLEGLTPLLDRPQETRERALCLIPVHQLKWCAIALNQFLPGDGSRRRFAVGVDATAQARQLAKAQRQLERVRQSLGEDRTWS